LIKFSFKLKLNYIILILLKKKKELKALF
jgi:hypothetical protein